MSRNNIAVIYSIAGFSTTKSISTIIRSSNVWCFRMRSVPKKYGAPNRLFANRQALVQLQHHPMVKSKLTRSTYTPRIYSLYSFNDFMTPY
jgi:hypothetical protein